MRSILGFYRVSKCDTSLRLALGFFLLLATLVVCQPQALAFGNGKQVGSQNEIDIKDPLTVRARFQPSTVEAGGTAELIMEMDLASGFHAYADRFKLVIESPDDFKLDQYKVTPIVPFKDAVSKSMKEGIEGKAVLRAVIEVPIGTKPAAIESQIRFTYQACTSEFCLFPKTLIVKTPLTIRGSESAAAAASAATVAAAPGAPPAADSGADLKSALERGLPSALLLMFVVGFLTALTPCIYPMIPITLAVLGVRAPRGGEKPSLWRSFSIAVVYVLGLAVTYSTLGVIAASTGSLFGSALSNVYVVTVIAIIFIAMGLGMFGLFEVQAPAFIRNRLGTGASPGQSRGGYLGAFSTGLVAGIVASPCIGPVLVSVLAFIAQTQNKTLGFLLLFSFALGMGIIFIVLGLSGNLLARLPKAGGWMEGVKFLFGMIMIGMAFYYIQPIYPKWLFLALLGVAGIMIASFYGAFDPLEHPPTNAQRFRRGAMLALFLFGTAFAIAGTMMRLGLLDRVAAPVASSTAPGSSSSPIVWKTYTPADFDAAVASGKPVIIDFMAEWCGACKELEELTYPNVAADMNKFVLFKVDATESTDEINAYTTKYNIVGLPTLLFFQAGGKALPELSLTGFEEAGAFAKRLDAALK
jgi:thiol:disulfide interchange protein DsbD